MPYRTGSYDERAPLVDEIRTVVSIYEGMKAKTAAFRGRRVSFSPRLLSARSPRPIRLATFADTALFGQITALEPELV